MLRTDAIILGGGIIGCSLAEELARRGQRVVVVERGRIGGEASSAAAGILSAQMDVPRPGVFFDLCQDARRAYPVWIKRLERQSKEKVGFSRSGVLYLAATAAEVHRMQARANWQTKQGLRVERWSAAEVRRHEPAVDGRFQAGFHFPLEGQVDNVLLMRALASVCRFAGVVLKEETKAERLLIRNNKVYGVQTSRGVFEAPVVVNTIGSWAGVQQFPIRLPVEPARGQIISFSGPKRLFRRPIMTERAYIVQREDGQILLGSTIERVGFKKALTVKGMHDILFGCRRISSKLLDCRYVNAWSGLRPYSRTGYPILGPTKVSGVYAATGHFRHGILLAPTTATVMADLILKGRSTFNLSPFYP